MRRNIEPDFEFEKEKYAEVLKRAIGDRTIATFVKEADSSAGYISKYLNLKCDVAPTIATIKKIASATKMVSYEELLQAAGYDPLKFINGDEETFLNGSAEPGKFMSFFNSVFTAVTRTDLNWRFSSSDNYGRNPFSVQIEAAPFKEWYFIPVYKQNVTKSDIVSALSGTEHFTINPGNKVSFLTSSEDIYKNLKEMEFGLLSLYISVLLVDVTSGAIKEEIYLKTATDLSDEDKETYSLLNQNGGENAPFYLI